MNSFHIPANETELLRALILKQPELFDSQFLESFYQPKVRKLIPDPLSKEIIFQIVKALRLKAPMSVIRMGDGEMNLLTFSQYPKLPELSYLTAAESVHKRPHSFKVNRSLLFQLEDLMVKAVNRADIVGVLGLWRTRLRITPELFIQKINKNIRGRWGHWTGLSYMSKLADQGMFKEKTITSAHLYFSVIQNLSELFKAVKNVYLITGLNAVQKSLTKAWPENSFHLVNVPVSTQPLKDFTPGFFDTVMSELPADMSCSLTLVGAGPWSEFYCTWIKERGGVAVDIGSGFDLLLGKMARPVHRKMQGKLDLNYF